MELLEHIAARLHDFYVLGWGGLLQSLAMAVAVVAVVMLFEFLFTSWRESSLRRLLAWSASARTDLLAFLLVETNLSLFIGMAMFFGVTYVAQHHVVRIGAAWGPLTIASPVVAMFVYIAVIDFANYWTHRLCHRLPLLWTIHRYHHSAPEMTVLTALRDHPMERALAALVVAVPSALLSVPAERFFALLLLAKAVGLFKHSNVLSNWGLIGRWLIQSPAAHRIHHSMDPAHHNTNFASLFQFWDVLFRTELHPTKQQAKEVRMGVVDDDGQHPPLRYIGEVFIDVGQRLRRRFHV